MGEEPAKTSPRFLGFRSPGYAALTTRHSTSAKQATTSSARSRSALSWR